MKIKIVNVNHIIVCVKVHNNEFKNLKCCCQRLQKFEHRCRDGAYLVDERRHAVVNQIVLNRAVCDARLGFHVIGRLSGQLVLAAPMIVRACHGEIHVLQAVQTKASAPLVQLDAFVGECVRIAVGVSHAVVREMARLVLHLVGLAAIFVDVRHSTAHGDQRGVDLVAVVVRACGIDHGDFARAA